MNSENNSRFYSQICGKLLGDGCFTRQVGRKPRFQFIHRIEDYGWTNYCYLNLASFIPLNPPKYKRTNDKRVKKGFTESYIAQSRTSDIITKLETLWYKDRVKQIPLSFLEKYLNDEALAWWFQDDGHLKITNGIPRKIILSTDNFSSIENKQIVNLLQRKFYIFFSIDGQNRLVLYDQPQIINFYRLISPYLHSSMERKTIKFNIDNKETLSKRTTISLPAGIKITKPTYEINHQLSVLPFLLKIIESRETYLYFYKENILPFRNKHSIKTYQIVIEPNHLFFINQIKKLTGLNNSEVTTLCFISNFISKDSK